MTRALVVDVDGVVAPVHGPTAWGDDVAAGYVFGPVHVSPTMCARLDQIATAPDLICAWLTSWSAEMRAAMNPFPGRSWVSVPPLPGPGTKDWWKRGALEAWLDEHRSIDTLCWIDDHLRPPARAAAIRRRLAVRAIRPVLLAPNTAIGLTPRQLDLVSGWLEDEGARTDPPTCQ